MTSFQQLNDTFRLHFYMQFVFCALLGRGRMTAQPRRRRVGEGGGGCFQKALD